MKFTKMNRFAMAALLACSTVAGAQTADLQSLIDRLDTNKLVIPPGEYRTDKTIIMKKLIDVNIIAEGVKLVITKIVPALKISQCKNLSISGLTIDYDPLPFTQGTISSVKDDGSIEFKIHAGYPRLDGNYKLNRIHIFDGKTRLWKRDIGDVYGKSVIISPDKGAFTPNKFVELSVGDLVCLNQRRCAGIQIGGQSENISMKALTLFTAPGVGILGRFGLGGDYFNVTIKRGPKPSGAKEARLISTSADGLNYAYTRNGPTLDGCDFSFMGDDGVNFHSVGFPIYELKDSHTLLTVRPYGAEGFPKVIKPGDKLRLLSGKQYKIVATVNIKSIEIVNDVKVTKKVLNDLFPIARKRKKLKYTVYKIISTSPFEKVKAGDFFDIPAIAASGFTIKNSYFHDHRGRGLRIMASDGEIINNRFSRIKQSAITLGAEYDYWREAGWVDNIIVSGNILEDIGTGYNIREANAYTPGAICTFIRMRDYKNCPQDNTNIIIENNRVNKCPVSAVFINASKNITIRNNTFINVCFDKTARAGAAYGFQSNKAVNIVNSSNIILKN